MSERPSHLPNFENPPVVEVALSVQFNPLAGLRVPQIGLLWQEYRKAFPKTQERPPLPPAVERFGVPAAQQASVTLEMAEYMPSRVWMLNESETELIQVQRDRFVHNWRGEGVNYPRYERVRDGFLDELRTFRAFLSREGIGDILPNQCEVTYVNSILPEPSVWASHGEIGRVITIVDTHRRANFLPTAEAVRFTSSYVMAESGAHEPLGRLHVSVEPRTKDDKPMILMTLLARGRPYGNGDALASVVRFFDLGRDWIVQAFADITTSDMHKVWRRIA